MKGEPLHLARVLIEGWARLYTLCLPQPQRQERLDLIRSDLWEQANDRAERHSAGGLIGRCPAGIAADMTWRVFEARRMPHEIRELILEGKPAVVTDKSLLPFLAIGAVVSWAMAGVFLLEPVEHSLVYAAALLGTVALAGWTLEARGDDEPGLSAWPVVVAIAITLLAIGALVDSGRAGMVVAIPLAAVLSARILARLVPRPRLREAGSGMMPAEALSVRAASGDAIAIERPSQGGVSRRALLRGGFALGLTSTMAAAGGIVVDFLWQRNVAGFGGVVTAGHVSRFPPGSKTRVREGKFWLVNLTAEQGGPGFLALWQKCPHLGCVVPWEERFGFVDPRSGDRTEGWFRCPCHQSTYDHAGVRVYGPAPRSMDRMALQIDLDGVIHVDTADVEKGTSDNAAYAMRAEPELGGEDTP